MKNLKNLALFFVLAFTLSSCIDNDNGFTHSHYKKYELMENTLNIPQEGPEEYNLVFPEYYGRESPFNKDEATLGRVMFYDKKLSADGTVSCASCHKQEIAFSDDKKVSDGINNQVTLRNSLALGAVFNFQEYYGPNRVPFFWDNSVQTVEEQIEFTFGSKNEMDMTLDQIVDVMNSNDYYTPLILALNSQEEKITKDGAVRALATFVNSIGSYTSRFDKALSKEANGRIGFGQEMNVASINFKDFTESENRGKSIYLSKCASCHGEIMGAPNVLQASNGIEVMAEDPGVAFTNGQFKVPSLRNLNHTYPYMHDGRFATIEEVLDHYSTGIRATDDLHPLLKEGSGNPRKFNFTEEERADLLAFFSTLDDPEFIADQKYSDPFKQ